MVWVGEKSIASFCCLRDRGEWHVIVGQSSRECLSTLVCFGKCWIRKRTFAILMGDANLIVESVESN